MTFDQFMDDCQRRWQADADLRHEYQGDFAAYVAERRAWIQRNPNPTRRASRGEAPPTRYQTALRIHEQMSRQRQPVARAPESRATPEPPANVATLKAIPGPAPSKASMPKPATLTPPKAPAKPRALTPADLAKVFAIRVRKLRNAGKSAHEIYTSLAKRYPEEHAAWLANGAPRLHKLPS